MFLQLLIKHELKNLVLCTFYCAKNLRMHFSLRFRLDSSLNTWFKKDKVNGSIVFHLETNRIKVEISDQHIFLRKNIEYIQFSDGRKFTGKVI